MLMVVNLDPHRRGRAPLDLDLGALGVDTDRPYQVHDLLGGGTLRLAGSRTSCKLDPHGGPRTCSAVEPRGATADDCTMACAMTPTIPLWYKDAVIYELHVRAFGDSDGDGIGDFRGLTERLDYLQRARRHRHLAAAVLPVAPARRRLRHRRLRRASTRPTARSATSRRFLNEAHQRGLRVITELVLNHTSRPAPLVPAGPPRAGRQPLARLLRLERHARQVLRDAGSSSRTTRPRTGPGTRSPAPTTGTASSPTSPTSTSTTPTCASTMLPDGRPVARDGRRRRAPRRRALPVRARGHELREPARDPRVPRASCGPTSTRTSRAACCSARPTSGPRTRPPTSGPTAATSATWRSTSR